MMHIACSVLNISHTGSMDRLDFWFFYSHIHRAGGQTVPLPVPPKPVPGGGRVHTVVSGNTLWKISEMYYRDGNQYSDIMTANSMTRKDLDIGRQLRTPQGVGG